MCLEALLLKFCMFVTSTKISVHKVHCEGFSLFFLFFIIELSLSGVCWFIFFFHSITQNEPQIKVAQFYTEYYALQCSVWEPSSNLLHNMINICHVLFVSHLLPRDKLSQMFHWWEFLFGFVLKYMKMIWQMNIARSFSLSSRLIWVLFHVTASQGDKKVKHMLFNTKFEEEMSWPGLTGS